MKFLQQIRWYWITRGIGAGAALYELALDHSPERGTIILAAFGLMGFDWVAKREEKAEPPPPPLYRRSAEEMQEIREALKRRKENK